MATPPTMRSDSRRNHAAIVSGAIAVLAEDPEASMREIADASGIGRTTLYRHFPDRAALVHAIYDRCLADAEAITARWLATSDDPVDVLAGLGVELSALGDRYRFLESHDAAVAAAHRAADIDRHVAPLRRYLAAAQRAGAVRGDLDARWLLDAFAALVMAAAESRVDPDRRADQLSATIRSVLAP